MARTIPSWLMISAALASFAALAGDPRDAEACSCKPPPTPEVALSGSDAVFEGRVVSAAAPSTGVVASTGSEVQVSLSVLRAWKGKEVGVDVGHEIKLSTPNGSATCGFAFQPSETYLVYAVRAQGGGLATNICMRTKRSADAADDVAALSAASPAQATPAQSSTASAGAPSPAPSADDIPFEADSGAKAIVEPVRQPPPKAGPPPKGGGCAGCALIMSDAGVVGGIAAAAFVAIAAALRRARRR